MRTERVSPQQALVNLLLGGRSPEQVVADVGAVLARDTKDPRPLITEAVRETSGMVHGRVSPIRVGRR